MDKIEQQIKRFSDLDIWDICLKILVKHKKLIAEFNKKQLFKGLTKNNEKITPNYFDDPVFPFGRWKSGEQYAAFKKKIKQNPYYSQKGYSTPDFYITGQLVHDMITAYIQGNELIVGPTGEAADFDDKYKDIYGVNEEGLNQLRELIYPEMMTQIRKQLGY